MAHKTAYLTNLNEFINSSHQRYQRQKYIEYLQNFLHFHQRNRRCLPDPKYGIFSSKAKNPLNTSPCFLSLSELSRPSSRSSQLKSSSSPILSLNSLYVNHSNKKPHIMTPTMATSTNLPNVSKKLQTQNLSLNMSKTSGFNNNLCNNLSNQTNLPNLDNSNQLRKMVTFKLPPSSQNVNYQRTRSAPPLYRSISENNLPIKNEFSTLRIQRHLPQHPLNKHPVSPTLPIAKLRLCKELNKKELKSKKLNLVNSSNVSSKLNAYCSRTYSPIINSSLYVNQFKPPYRNTVSNHYPNCNISANQFISKNQQSYSHSLPNSPFKRAINNNCYHPTEYYTIGPNGMLSSHGNCMSFYSNIITPSSSTTITSPNSLPTYTNITFLDPSYSNRINYNNLLLEKPFARLKHRIPICKSTPPSAILSNSHLINSKTAQNIQDKVNASSYTNSSYANKLKLYSDDNSKFIESPLAQMRKEIKYFVDERKKQLEQNIMSTNNTYLNQIDANLNCLPKLQDSLNSKSVLNYINDNNNNNSLINNIKPKSTCQHISSSESDLNALLNMFSFPPDPVLDRTPPAGVPNYQRLPQFMINHNKQPFNLNYLGRDKHSLLNLNDNLINNEYFLPYHYKSEFNKNKPYDALGYYNNFTNNFINSNPTLIPTNCANTTLASDCKTPYYASCGSLRTSPILSHKTYHSSIYNNLNKNLYFDYAKNHNYYKKFNYNNTLEKSFSRPCSPVYQNCFYHPYTSSLNYLNNENFLLNLPTYTSSCLDLNNSNFKNNLSTLTSSANCLSTKKHSSILPIRTYRS